MGIDLELIGTDTALVMMDVIPLLGPTHVSVSCYASYLPQHERRHIKHALETLYSLGMAERSWSSHADYCYGRKE